MIKRIKRIPVAIRAAYHALRGAITDRDIERLVSGDYHLRKTARGYTRKGRKSRADGYAGPMPGDK